MSDKPPPRPPLRPRLVTDEAPLSSIPPPRPAVRSERPQAAIPPPVPSRDQPRPEPPPTARAAAPRPVTLGDDDQATKLFNSATAEQAELVVVSGQYKGKSVPLGAGTCVIGRSSECELCLKGVEGASRRHCKVQYLGNRFVVIDLESRNGTVVNGEAVDRKVLEQGDRIEIGEEVIQFVVHRLADLGLIDDSLSPFEETGSKTVPQPSSSSPHVARTLPGPDDILQLAGPATGSVAGQPGPVAAPQVIVQPVFVPVVAPPAPPTPQSSSSRLPYVFGALAIVVLGGGGALVYDLVFRTPDEPVSTVVDTAVPVVAVPPPVEPTPAPTPVVVDARPAVVAAVVDAGPAPVVDAGPAATTATTTTTTTPASTTPTSTTTTTAASVVRADAAGRASAIKVKVGDVVTVGDVLVVLGGDNGTLARKLDTLRREEREFAGSSDADARAELEEIRKEMKRISARLETKPVVSTAAGTVVEVLVKEGDVVRDAAPIVVLGP